MIVAFVNVSPDNFAPCELTAAPCARSDLSTEVASMPTSGAIGISPVVSISSGFSSVPLA